VKRGNKWEVEMEEKWERESKTNKKSKLKRQKEDKKCLIAELMLRLAVNEEFNIKGRCLKMSDLFLPSLTFHQYTNPKHRLN